MKLVAVLGVMGAVVVTSFNLSYIGHATFDPRLEEANAKISESAGLDAQKTSLLERIDAQKTSLLGRIKESENTLQGKRNDLAAVESRYKSTSDQISTTKQGKNTTTTTTETGSRTVDTVTNAQLIALNKQLPVVKQERERASAAVQQVEADLKMINAQAELNKTNNANELAVLDDKIGKVSAEYRDIINHSELHSFTGMLFGKSPKEVSEGEVKTLEWYLILIPSIAAALASTLIAMTAVHRIKPPKPASSPTMPDEALAYLFGPLITAIRTEARNTVTTALNGRSKTTSSRPDT